MTTNDYEPATPEQLETLHQLGVPCPSTISRSFAEHALSYHRATPQQLECLARLGIRVERPITRKQASDLIGQSVPQRRQLPPTDKQRYVLKQHGQWRDDLT